MCLKYIRTCKKCGGEFPTNNSKQRFHVLCTDKGKKDLLKRQKNQYLKNKSTADYHLKKREVNARDDLKCQVCGLDLRETDKIRHTHHIDKNRKNNNYKNLITLCNHCHSNVHAGNIPNLFKVKSYVPKIVNVPIYKPEPKFLFKNI